MEDGKGTSDTISGQGDIEASATATRSQRFSRWNTENQS